MKLQDKLDAMHEDCENGRFPQVPPHDQFGNDLPQINNDPTELLPVLDCLSADTID